MDEKFKEEIDAMTHYEWEIILNKDCSDILGDLLQKSQKSWAGEVDIRKIRVSYEIGSVATHGK